jgi:hypothetical protein
MEWFKVQSELLNNRKFQCDLSDMLKVRLLNLWCLCASLNGELPSVTEMAFRLRISDGDMIDTIKELKEAGFLDEVNPGVYIPHDWDDHNPPTSISDRVKKHREKRKLEIVTPCNAQSNDGALHGNAQSNVTTLQPVTSVTTRREEKDKNIYPPNPLPKELAESFHAAVALHPNQNGTDLALQTLIGMHADGRVTEADADAILAGMRHWAKCADWCDRDPQMLPKGSSAKEYYFSMPAWFRDRAWKERPQLSAEAMADARTQTGYTGPEMPAGWVHPALRRTEGQGAA